MNSNIAIRLTGVTKQYTIHHEKPTLVEKMVKGREEKFLALNNVNLTIKKGEKVGLPAGRQALSTPTDPVKQRSLNG